MSNSNYPNSQNSAAGAIPVWVTSGPAGGRTGVSASGSVTTASTSIITAAQFPNFLTLQNTSSGGQTIYVSFNTPATASDFAIAAGGAITYPYGLANSIQAIASAAGATFAATGA